VYPAHTFLHFEVINYQLSIDANFIPELWIESKLKRMSNSTSSAINAARIKYGCKPTGTSFPCMIYQCLQDIQVLGERDETLRHLGKIISWQTHGRAFKIHNRKNFIELVMPIWFPKIKYSSFTRQCCLYGFTRIQDKGEDYNGKQIFLSLCLKAREDARQHCSDSTLSVSPACSSPLPSALCEGGIRLGSEHAKNSKAEVQHCPDVVPNHGTSSQLRARERDPRRVQNFSCGMHEDA